MSIFPPKELYARTGNQRARFNTLVQLAAQTRADDRYLLEQAQDLLFVPDLLNYFLCGEKAAEFTIASVSQLYDRKEGRWDAEIMQAFGIRQGLFPHVIPSATKLGEAKRGCPRTERLRAVFHLYGRASRYGFGCCRGAEPGETLRLYQQRDVVADGYGDRRDDHQ